MSIAVLPPPLSLPSLANLQHVHCIGIGGSGLSGLAKLLMARGLTVTGSDPSPSATTERLIDHGIVIDHVQNGSLITPRTQLVVHSAAIRHDNVDYLKAQQLNIPTAKYSEVLGLLMAERIGVAVAGTHGKTTTTSMVAHIFEYAAKRPSWVIGGVPHDLKESAHHGNGFYFIAEACEYDRSFLNLCPLLTIVNNIEADHLDYYRDLSEIRAAFADFVSKVPPAGAVFVNADCPNAMPVVEQAAVCALITFGTKRRDADWQPEVIDFHNGHPRFVLKLRGRTVLEVQLKVPGAQNVMNATAATALAAWVGIDLETIREALENFHGVRRRFDLLGELRGVPVIDDYAHHPTKVAATLKAARQVYPTKRIWAVFQPHQASRTEDFFEAFAEALALADRVLVLDVFAAREQRTVAQCQELSRNLAAAVRQRGIEAWHKPDPTELVEELRWGLEPNVALFTLGAGPVNEIAEALLKR